MNISAISHKYHAKFFSIPKIIWFLKFFFEYLMSFKKKQYIESIKIQFESKVYKNLQFVINNATDKSLITHAVIS